MAKLNLSKSGLQKQREDLNLYQRVLPSLDLKRMQLMGELKRAQQQLTEAEAEVERLNRRVAEQLPMLANREIDVITAVISSINAVLRNKPAMLVWATLISALTLLGFLTAGIGLIIIIPWLAYATWHGYRAALDVSEWSVLPRDESEQS